MSIVTGDLIGDKDGVNVEFSIPIILEGSVLIIFNSSTLYQIGSPPIPPLAATQVDTSEGVNVTLGLTPQSADNLSYYGDDEVEMHHGDLLGNKNGLNQNFTIPESIVLESLLIFWNTSILYPVAASPVGTQCIISLPNVVVSFPPVATDNLWYYGEPI